MDKTQEIRKALESATPGKLHKFHGNIALTSDDIIGSLTVATAYYTNFAELFANSKEWLSYLLDEVDHARRCAEDAWKREDELESLLDTAKQENERLRGAIDELFKNREKWREYSMELEVERASSIRKLEQAAETLEWYAEEDNYRRSEEEYHQGYPQEIMWDKGIKARKALSFIREGESK